MDSASRARSRSSIRVYLVVENRLMREALARLLQKQSDVSIVGQNSCSETSSRQVVNAGCDVLVSDSLESICTVAPDSELPRDRSRLRTILFGMEDDPERFLDAVRQGVCGYLLKDASSSEIVSAVRSVARGEAVCPTKMTMALFNQFAQEFRQRAGLADDEAAQKLGLTFRQRQLLTLIAQGLSNKEIATNLNLSECTVKNHVYRIMKHVEADSRQDAVDLVRSRGYLPTDLPGKRLSRAEISRDM
jgi:DNA-binding NarL/FixJ family response regulator